VNMIEAQKAARQFAVDHIRNVQLGLPQDLTDGQYNQVMDAILRSMIAAWGDGYYTDLREGEEHGKR
jgi:hypothetical protein